MKVFIAGEIDAFIKEFAKLNKDLNCVIADKKADMARYEVANEAFCNKNYDAVVYNLPFNSSTEGELTDVSAIIKFKNVQYSAIVNGVKKMLVLTDSLSTMRELDFESEDKIEKAIPTNGTALTDYLITLLASKDKISTVLRAFGLYGNTIKPQRSHAMKIVGAALSKKEMFLSCDGVVNALYSQDYIKIISLFLRNSFPKSVYNIAPEETYTLIDIAKRARSSAKRYEKEFSFEYEDDESFVHTAQNKRLRAVLPEFRFTSLASGINKTFGEKYK